MKKGPANIKRSGKIGISREDDGTVKSSVASLSDEVKSLMVQAIEFTSRNLVDMKFDEDLRAGAVDRAYLVNSNAPDDDRCIPLFKVTGKITRLAVFPNCFGAVRTSDDIALDEYSVEMSLSENITSSFDGMFTLLDTFTENVITGLFSNFLCLLVLTNL